MHQKTPLFSIFGDSISTYEGVLPEGYGVDMQDFGTMVSRVARDRGCSVLELWDEHRLCDTVDGLHPNYQGMCTLAQQVIEGLEAAGLTPGS